MTLALQVDLDALRPLDLEGDLPRGGVLQVFADVRAHGAGDPGSNGVRVLLHPAGVPLRPATPPPGCPVPPPRTLVPGRHRKLPPLRLKQAWAPLEDAFAALADEPEVAPSDVRDHLVHRRALDFWDHWSYKAAKARPEPTYMLGWPDGFTTEVPLDRWRLLAHVAVPPVEGGDAAILEVMVPGEDLAAGRLDRIRALWAARGDTTGRPYIPAI